MCITNWSLIIRTFLKSPKLRKHTYRNALVYILVSTVSFQGTNRATSPLMFIMILASGKYFLTLSKQKQINAQAFQSPDP